MPDEPRRQKTLPAWLLPTPARRDERAGPPLREFTLRLMRGEDLRREEAAALLDALLDGAATDAQIGAAARVAGVRRELGVHTTFNLLGPLTNPAGAPRQVIGVWHEALVEPLAHTLLALGSERAWVVHGLDGLDEVTLAAPTKVAEVSAGAVRVFEVEPEEFGLERSPLEALRGGD